MKNFKFTAQAIFSDGTSKCRVFATERAVSNWANRQYHKDENVTVNVYEFWTNHLVMTYHA